MTSFPSFLGMSYNKNHMKLLVAKVQLGHFSFHQFQTD